jgi:hypothetical protein
MLRTLMILAALSLAPVGGAQAAGITVQIGPPSYDHHDSHYHHKVQRHRVCGWVPHYSRHHNPNHYRTWECMWR